MKIHTIITILFLITSTTVYAQKRVKVTGYVRDADGNPLELVNILVKNTLNGTMTNENLLNARNAYRIKHGLLTSDDIKNPKYQKQKQGSTHNSQLQKQKRIYQTKSSN